MLGRVLTPIASMVAVLGMVGLLAGCSGGSADTGSMDSTRRAALSGPSDQASGAPTRPPVVVALGDSFASGPGIATQRGGACARSDHNYAHLLATALHATLRDVSCSGARIADFGTAQGAGIPAQYDALGPDATLVLLGTIGGNDVGLVQAAATCVLGECVDNGRLARSINALRAPLTAAVRTVQRRAPQAEVVLVGYPITLPKQPCAAMPGVTGPELNHLRTALRQLNRLQRSVAQATGITFADLSDLPGAARHTLCAAPDRQWLRGLDAHGDGMMLHPSSAGMRAAAAALAQLLAPSTTD